MMQVPMQFLEFGNSSRQEFWIHSDARPAQFLVDTTANDLKILRTAQNSTRLDYLPRPATEQRRTTFNQSF